MATTVPMLAPDGTSGDIPQDKVQAALQAGFKQAVEMKSPDGKLGYIPSDRMDEATKAGFMQPGVKVIGKNAAGQPIYGPEGDTSTPPQTFGHALSAAGDVIGNAAKSLIPQSWGDLAKRTIPGYAQYEQVVKPMIDQGQQAIQAAQSGHPALAAGHGLAALVPVVGPQAANLGQQVGTQIGTGDYAGAAGTLGGNAALVAGAAALPKVVGAVGDTASALYPTSQSIVPKVSAARNLAKALVVEPQAAPNFIKAATDEAGTIVGYAKENNLPINSKVDFANAAKATADAVQSHFDSILAPSADQVSAVPASYQGVRVGEGPNATLGSINDRINAINQELKPNFRKATAAQTSTANVSDADLIAEKQALTNLLHNKLASDSGLQASDIADIRQQAGKLRTIADEANLSANRDTAAAGKQAMGATTSAVGTKVGMIDRVLQAAQGGPEIIGNRQVLSALKNVAPQPLNLPQPTAAVPPVTSRMEQLLAESKQRFAQQRANQLINSALKMYPEQQ